MEKKERIVRQIRGENVDRIPLFGGWNEGAGVLAKIAGITVEEFMRDALSGVIKANEALHIDGMTQFIVPKSTEEIRSGNLEEAEYEHHTPEELLERAEQIPATEEAVLEKHFDAREVEHHYRTQLSIFSEQIGDIVFIPNFWEAVTNFSLYFTYGYTAFLAATGLYPDAVERIWWEDGIYRRACNKILAGLIHEMDLPPLFFSGHDICYNSGPMCSPDYLRKAYWPHVKYALEPFLEADIRLVHHCDGNVMPIIDDMIEAGFSGFQGFQYEVGVDPYELAKRRSLKGEKMLFMAGLSCSRTLPFGTEADIKEEIDFIFDYTEGGHGLFLFPSNVTGVETPPENIMTAYRYAESIGPASWKRTQPSPRPWPWGETHEKKTQETP